jgi:hypothetical protein
LQSAHLVGVYGVGEMPEELNGFVRFQAYHLKYVPKKEERVAMLQIMGTTSYFPIFIDNIMSIEEVERQLLDVDARLDEVSRTSLVRILQEKLYKGGP